MSKRFLAPAASLFLVLALAGCGGGDEEPAASACTPLTDEEIADIVGGDEGTDSNWKGDGEVTVTAAEKTPTDGGGDMFTEVIYVQVDAPGIEGQVFTFATAPEGLLVGADTVTREFWTWGDAAVAGSPVDEATKDAVDAVEAACLS